MSNDFILTWGRRETDNKQDIENEFIERNITTKHKLAKMRRNCERRGVLHRLRGNIGGYENELFLLAETYDREIYNNSPVYHDISSIYFVFDPYSDLEPMAQYNYGSIYEYVDYLEKAMISLKYETSDTIERWRIDYCHNIRSYANMLENRAWQYDTHTMDAFAECDWFNPLRRYMQLELGDSITLLETHLLANYTKQQLRKLHSESASDASYLLSLSRMTFHLQNKK
jgi:hypothetical protein